MKKLLLIFLFIPLVSFGQKNTESELIMKINAVQHQLMAQGNITEEEEQAILSLCSIMSKEDGLANYSPDDRMILKDVEIAPIYNGCEKLSKKEIKRCFNTKVSTFIKQEFNLDISRDLNLSELRQVEAFFIINEKEITHEQENFIREFFIQKVSPAVVTIMLNDLNEFPLLKDTSGYLAVKLVMNSYDEDEKDEIRYAVVEIPNTINRFVVLPSNSEKQHIILLDDVIPTL